MEKIYFAFPGNEALTETLSRNHGCSRGDMEMRRFPDGECYVRINSDVCAKNVILVCSLNNPDEKLLGIHFFSDIARSMNAASVTLVCPYLPYMRQDKIFHKGEGVTSLAFAKLLSTFVDELITVDPHLHRFHALSDLYSIKTKTISAAEPIAEWIKAHVNTPFIIGPDSESEQWIKRVAENCNAPYAFLNKRRYGDKQVEVSVPNDLQINEATPVLVDDIISTGNTIIQTIGRLKAQKTKSPVCIGVHGIFAGNAYRKILESGAAQIVTTNTVPHLSNKIDIAYLLGKD